MLTFRRALVVAAVLLTFFLLLRNTHPAGAAKINNSPKPTGSHADNRKIVEALPEGVEKLVDQAKAASTAPTKEYKDENGGRIALKHSRPQIALEDLKLRPLRQQISYSFPYDPEGKFPAYIWQTWKVTPASGEFNEDWRPAEASWTELHPSFVHEVITDSVASHLIKHFYASIPEVVEAYESLPEPVLKADFFRYLILLARGGIYSDIDTTALKSAVEWVPSEVPRSSYGLVIGIEADPDRPDWHDWYSRRIQFCQWTIQSKPGHPVLVDIVATITEDTLRRKKAGELDRKHIKSVVEFTGPALWTDTIFKFFNNPEFFDMSTSKGNITWQQFTGITQAKKVGDVVVLPITSFSPGVQQMGAQDIDDPMAFVQHTFEGTWKPESERHIGEQDKK
ncbi:Initiation-specific alpha-1,6-mannosyltransferase [Pseudocercospora fuligena]|uniref:Initiation-specific alpha-1,6-mannosyltransferase n=1 Tax=Pseudocercospora fuligena TaxID=685502 RepID=A0A8H6RT47_9PEZI|nr:Initiation-specific alpha-1,6-mannosyltransferase [Pseudocercospora fuligena]